MIKTNIIFALPCMLLSLKRMILMLFTMNKNEYTVFQILLIIIFWSYILASYFKELREN